MVLKLINYFFISLNSVFDCTGSSLLHGLFSNFGEQGLFYNCAA